MQLLRTFRLIVSFYRSFFFTSLVVTTCCLTLFWRYGFSIFSTLFWFKIATLGMIYYFINAQKKKEYYYYQNLGLSKMILWTTTLIFDFCLFLFLLIQLYRFK